MNMSCTKCGGEGLEHYTRDGGKCYACGAMPKGQTSQVGGARRSRVALVNEVRIILNKVAVGDLQLHDQWDPDYAPTGTVEDYILALATLAGTDVHARAEAAIARIYAGTYVAA